jgi:hypothetical protein
MSAPTNSHRPLIAVELARNAVHLASVLRAEQYPPYQ